MTKGTQRLATNLNRRLLQADSDSGTVSANKSSQKLDGADGEVIAESEKEATTGYPNKLFSDESIQNGAFMVYLFCKYQLSFKLTLVFF